MRGGSSYQNTAHTLQTIEAVECSKHLSYYQANFSQKILTIAAAQGAGQEGRVQEIHWKTRNFRHYFLDGLRPMNQRRLNKMIMVNR